MDQRLAELSPFAVSLALGALVGIERERSHTETPGSFAGGVRTFPLVAVLGCLSAWLHAQIGAVGFAMLSGGFILLVVASYVISSFRGASGTTTALASLLTFAFGIMVFHDRSVLAAALAVGMTALLSLRRPLHQLTSKLEEADLYAALKLAALTVIVLPLLPDRTFGPSPFDALNPFRIWLLVVLVAAVGFLGYVGVKVLGPGRGIIVAGLLGGLVSSTAATFALAGRSRESPELSRELALGIALAWATMCVRVLVIVAFLDPALVPVAAGPLLAAMVAGVLAASVGYLGAHRAASSPAVSYTNPFSALSAVRFGAIFTTILVAAKLAEDWFQEAGLLVAAAVSGTVDVDAMTLVLARLSSTHVLSPRLAVIGLSLAAGSNTIVKTAVALSLGSAPLRRALIAPALGTLAAGGAGLYLSLSRL